MQLQCPNCQSFNIKSAGIHHRCQQCLHSWYVTTKMVVSQSGAFGQVYTPRENTRKFYCHDHQGKAAAYLKALQRAGYERAEKPEGALFMLTDADISGRGGQINRFYTASRGGRVFLYPHTAAPMWLWDGIYQPSPYITCVFGIAAGSAYVPASYGYGGPIHPVGWTYTRQRKFRKCKDPRRVLFAPIHANGNGYLSPRQQETNARTFSLLLPLAQNGQIELTVRHLHKLEWNGLEYAPGVQYVQGKPDQTIAEIDAADVVVSKSNMQYMSVSRGVPTVGMAEEYPPMTATSAKNTHTVQSWGRYMDYMQFPIDIFENDDTMQVLKDAAASDERVELWRERFIGSPFDAKKFVKILESYLW